MENIPKTEVIVITVYRNSPEKIEAHRQAVKRYQLRQGDEYLRYGREYSANYRIHVTEEQKEKQKSYGYDQYVKYKNAPDYKQKKKEQYLNVEDTPGFIAKRAIINSSMKEKRHALKREAGLQPSIN